MKIEYLQVIDHDASWAPMDTSRWIARTTPTSRVRVPIWGQAKLTLPGDLVLNGYAMDISHRHVRISVRQPLAIKQTCVLYLVVRHRGELLKITVGARVISCVCCSDSFQLGLQLAAVDSDAAVVIEKLTAGAAN